MLAAVWSRLIDGPYSSEIGLAGLGAILLVGYLIAIRDLLVRKLHRTRFGPDFYYANRRSMTYKVHVAIYVLFAVACTAVVLCGLVGAAAKALGHPEYDVLPP